jgi:hypothetical protein
MASQNYLIKRSQLINRLVCSDSKDINKTAEKFLNKNKIHIFKLLKSNKDNENITKKDETSPFLKNINQSSTNMKSKNQSRYVDISEPLVNLTRGPNPGTGQNHMRDQNMNRGKNTNRDRSLSRGQNLTEDLKNDHWDTDNSYRIYTCIRVCVYIYRCMNLRSNILHCFL